MVEYDIKIFRVHHGGTWAVGGRLCKYEGGQYVDSKEFDGNEVSLLDLNDWGKQVLPIPSNASISWSWLMGTNIKEISTNRDLCPTPPKEDWDEPGYIVYPPIKERRPGRPRVNRIRGEDEGGKGQRACGTCGEYGHNQRTCQGGPIGGNTRGRAGGSRGSGRNGGRPRTQMQVPVPPNVTQRGRGVSGATPRGRGTRGSTPRRGGRVSGREGTPCTQNQSQVTCESPLPYIPQNAQENQGFPPFQQNMSFQELLLGFGGPNSEGSNF